MLILGDSLAFHGPRRAEPPGEPRLFGNVLARRLGAEADLSARMGWTARDAWWSLTKDPVVWGAYLPRATALVLALGSFDQLPAAVPTWARESIHYVRPGGLRRRVRSAFLAAAPRVIAASDGRFSQLSPAASNHYHDRIIQAVRTLRPDLPVVRLLPSPYRSHLYPAQRPHAPAVTAARAWCAERGVPAVDLDVLVTTDTNNPDGLHWGWDSHERVGKGTAETLLAAGWAP